MNPNDIARRLETKAYAYGVSSTVATLLGEYMKDLLKETPRAIAVTKTAVCPLCDEKMENVASDFIHAWKCPACPFVGFEFFGSVDVEHLANALNIESACSTCEQPTRPDHWDEAEDAMKSVLSPTDDIGKTLKDILLRLDEMEANCDLRLAIANDRDERLARAFRELGAMK